jgi:hypothetical protein
MRSRGVAKKNGVEGAVFFCSSRPIKSPRLVMIDDEASTVIATALGSYDRLGKITTSIREA